MNVGHYAFKVTMAKMAISLKVKKVKYITINECRSGNDIMLLK